MFASFCFVFDLFLFSTYNSFHFVSTSSLFCHCLHLYPYPDHHRARAIAKSSNILLENYFTRIETHSVCSNAYVVRPETLSFRCEFLILNQFFHRFNLLNWGSLVNTFVWLVPIENASILWIYGLKVAVTVKVNTNKFGKLQHVRIIKTLDTSPHHCNGACIRRKAQKPPAKTASLLWGDLSWSFVCSVHVLTRLVCTLGPVIPASFLSVKIRYACTLQRMSNRILNVVEYKLISNLLRTYSKRFYITI